MNDDILKKYNDYLETLATNKSSEIFSNGGKEFASILMAILFEHTQKEVRIFCEGFKPDLIKTDPYFSELQKYLKDRDKQLKVLVETDQYFREEPFSLLKKAHDERKDNSVSYRKIREEDRKYIIETLGNNHCHFAIFDADKFRLEYEPKEYKAFGSFNHPENCTKLIKLFDKAFAQGVEI